MIGQILLALSFLVGVHELGHMLAAKAFGMRVEKFSIGFPPKVIGFKKGDTTYQLGAIPLGGFVKISGMVDESFDTKGMATAPEPWEFRAKPAWQRLIVMLGGIIVNLIVGVIIFVFLTYGYGDERLPIAEVEGIQTSQIAQDMGLQDGDRIIGVNGQKIQYFEDIVSGDVLLGDNVVFTVERGEETLQVPVPNDLVDKLSDKKNRANFISPIHTFTVGEVKSEMAQAAGLEKGDRILSVNGDTIAYFQDFQAATQAHKEETINAVVLREGGAIDTLALYVDAEAVVGFQTVADLPTETTLYTFGQSIPKGAGRAFGVVFDNIKAFGKIFKGHVSASNAVSGPISIAGMFGREWIWQRFWTMTAILSMILAFMNFLPIPALDGGHVMFLLYEMITGRTLSVKFMEVALKVGMALVLSLMIFAIVNDVLRL